MREIGEVIAYEGYGLNGDRYATGEGSFNKANPGSRQVTLMNTMFFENSGFTFRDSRRNLFVEGVELMWLIGRVFQVGSARFSGVKYCEPCQRPSNLAAKPTSFKEAFLDRGGLVAEVVETGVIRLGSEVVIPSKRY